MRTLRLQEPTGSYAALSRALILSCAIAAAPASAQLVGSSSRGSETKSLIRTEELSCTRRATRTDEPIILRASSSVSQATIGGQALVDVGAIMEPVALTLGWTIGSADTSSPSPAVIPFQCAGNEPEVADGATVTLQDSQARVVLKPSDRPYRLLVRGGKVGDQVGIAIRKVAPAPLTYTPVGQDGMVDVVLGPSSPRTVTEDRPYGLIDLRQVRSGVKDSDVMLVQYVAPSDAIIEPGKVDLASIGEGFQPAGRLFSSRPSAEEKERGAIWRVGTGPVLRIYSAGAASDQNVRLRVRALPDQQPVAAPIRITGDKFKYELTPDDPLRDEVVGASGVDVIRRLQPYKLFIFHADAGKRYFAKAKSDDFDTFLSIGFLAVALNGASSERLRGADGLSFYAIGSNDDRSTNDGKVISRDSCITFVPAKKGDLVFRVMPSGRPSFGKFTIDVDTSANLQNSCNLPDEN